LSSSVPYLKLYIGFIVHRYEARAKLDTNSEVMCLFEPLVSELKKEARFANAAVTDDNVLESVSKRHNFNKLTIIITRCTELYI
jgi:hypothetical protein